MSFAYKLWKIGQALTEKEIWDALSDSGKNPDGSEHQYINIDFTITRDEVSNIELKKDSIRREKLFFTEKIGGTGNSYYLYPNLKVHNSKILKVHNSKIKDNKVQLLVNTLKYGMLQYVDEQNRKYVDTTLSEIEGIKKYIERSQIEFELSELVKKRDQLFRQSGQEEAGSINQSKELKRVDKNIKKVEQKIRTLKDSVEKWNISLLEVCHDLVTMPKGDYWIWLSINGKTFFELMPEVKENWFKKPVLASHLKKGFDAFTNKETEVGYKPEVKIFSYNEYHNSMKYRLNENLPLSLDSARNIRFAWMYILNNLVFYFKDLEYVLVPNFLSDDTGLYRSVLNRFRRANAKSNNKRSVLEQHYAQEKRLEKDIEKIAKKNNEKNFKKLQVLKQQHKKLSHKINQMDTGLIREFDEQIKEIGDIKNSITIDYLFTKIDFKNRSFEIKGTLEDVIPSQIRKIVSEMSRPDRIINDRVKLSKRDRNETFLQDYFNRQELSFVLSGSQKNNANAILQERLYLARLLLTDTQIDIDSLMARFEENRLYGYDNKRRLTKGGTCEWIEYTSHFIRHDINVYNFLKQLNKIKSKDSAYGTRQSQFFNLFG